MLPENIFSDSKHMVNMQVFNVDQIIDGYNFHSVLYDKIKHIDPVVHTTKYNNDSTFTNQWANWSGISKITGEELKLTSSIAGGNGKEIKLYKRNVILKPQIYKRSSLIC